MRFAVLALAAALGAAAPALSQTGPAPSASAPRAADTVSPDAIVAALYEVISGDAGVARDWDRFRGLFHPTAGRLMAIGRTPEGATVLRTMTPQDYVDRAGPSLVKDGFHEREIARKLERYGRLVHVFSTYEARRRADDPAPFMRGINSIQLFDDGTRWWVLSVYWQPETAEFPLTSEHLPPS